LVLTNIIRKYFKLNFSLTELVLSSNNLQCLAVPILKLDMVTGEKGDINSGTMSDIKEKCERRVLVPNL
jgi:hypothetical protein